MKVLSKQLNSIMCYVCGVENDSGLKAEFYNLEDEMVGTILSFGEKQQSYPERVHGGIVSTLFDELMGRVLWCNNPNAFAVTTTMTVKYRKPVPYDKTLKGVGYYVKKYSRMYVAKGKLFDENDNLLAEAEGTYLIQPTEKITEDDTAGGFVMVDGMIDKIDFPPFEK